MNFTVTQPFENIYVILQEFVRCFLIVGNKRALLIDTGVNEGDEIFKFIKSVTPLPVAVYLTHADMDHVAAAKSFGVIHINMADKDLFLQNQPDSNAMFNPVTDGEIIDIGGLTFKSIYIPGHTRGSMAYLCRENGILFSGDSVQEGPIFMFGENRSLTDFIESSRKLLAIKSAVKTIYPCHHTLPLPPDYIDHVLGAAIQLKNGEIPAQPCDRDLPCQLYRSGKVDFYYY